MNNINKKQEFVRTVISVSVAATVIGAAYGGVPLNNLQGTGGIAFNPLAYTAGLPWDGDDGGDTTNEVAHSALNGVVSRPQVGAWYVNLNDAGVNWWAVPGSSVHSLAVEALGASWISRPKPCPRL